MYETNEQTMMKEIMKNCGIQELTDKLWEQRREFFNPMKNWGHACSLALYMEFDINFGMCGTIVYFYDPATGRSKAIEEDIVDGCPFKAAMLAICKAACYLGSIK